MIILHNNDLLHLTSKYTKLSSVKSIAFVTVVWMDSTANTAKDIKYPCRRSIGN